MSLARAFTSRRSKPEVSPITPHRSGSARMTNGKPVQRSQISAPIQLLSTTNMLSFNAPDIHISNSAASSVTSGDDSDLSRSAQNSPDTSVDGSPIESRPSSPDANHLSIYFQPGPLDSIARKGSDSSTDGPAIPKRAPSHTKASHRAMAQKRAQARMSPPVTMPKAQDSVLSVGSSHPFGKELQQVNEVAEEFGVRDDLFEEEEQLKERGLLKFGAQDYISEIQSLFGGVFEDKFLPMAWI
ncbi:MAG: hypothetical protein M1816_006433 [Peltula sp. TS41687]|nr:MAG: hypothetical protein M1816_006433 [Peltula sp. TS41687]